MRTKAFKIATILVVSLLVVAASFAAHGCMGGRKKLVEQFDNGPIGGPPGASEGYLWVSEDDNPTPGKNWKPTDPATLTPEQQKRIHASWP